MASSSASGNVRLPDEITGSTFHLTTIGADANVEDCVTTSKTHRTYDTCYTFHCISLFTSGPLLPETITPSCASARSAFSGAIRTPPLPYFPAYWRDNMESSRQYQIPTTPRVISPSPTPSEAGSGRDGYFGPVTRSAARKNRQRVQSPPQIDEDSSGSDPEKRARARSRSPILETALGKRMNGLTSRRQMNGSLKNNIELPTGITNGHLSPAAANKNANKNYWREMSRSPSPLGLIPIHQKWRSFVRTCWDL